jgi:N-acetylglucosaminyl-diphospho-decaprenol L-rhamnosyltransferase
VDSTVGKGTTWSPDRVDVVAIVVAHNSAQHLARCLPALAAAASRTRLRIVVSDAGSADDPAEICERVGAVFIPGENSGLAAAFNRALDHPATAGARYLLQLNPDVGVGPGGLDELVRVADRHRQCGILAPRQVDELGELRYSIGVEPSPATYWHALVNLPGDWIWDAEHYGREQSVDWMMGACLLLRAEMLRSVGGFDERFFLCSEEVDLCRRAREAGWSVMYTPEVTVVHPQAPLPGDAHRVRLEEWSRILYLRKWNPAGRRASIRLAIATRLTFLAALERVHLVPPRHAGVRLAAAMRFDRRRYGPASY